MHFFHFASVHSTVCIEHNKARMLFFFPSVCKENKNTKYNIWFDDSVSYKLYPFHYPKFVWIHVPYRLGWLWDDDSRGVDWLPRFSKSIAGAGEEKFLLVLPLFSVMSGITKGNSGFCSDTSAGVASLRCTGTGGAGLVGGGWCCRSGFDSVVGFVTVKMYLF